MPGHTLPDGKFWCDWMNCPGREDVVIECGMEEGENNLYHERCWAARNRVTFGDHPRP